MVVPDAASYDSRAKEFQICGAALNESEAATQPSPDEGKLLGAAIGEAVRSGRARDADPEDAQRSA
jgi:hypothetical protein